MPAERMKFPAPATFGGLFDGQSKSHLLLVLLECSLPVAADILPPEGGSKKNDECREPRFAGSHLVPPLRVPHITSCARQRSGSKKCERLEILPCAWEPLAFCL